MVVDWAVQSVGADVRQLVAFDSYFYRFLSFFVEVRL